MEWHKKRSGQHSSNLLLPSFPCPAFSSLAMMEDSFSEWVFNSESFKEYYVLLLFMRRTVKLRVSREDEKRGLGAWRCGRRWPTRAYM